MGKRNQPEVQAIERAVDYAGKLETALERVGNKGLTEKTSCRVNALSMGIYLFLITGWTYGGKVSKPIYKKVIGLFEEAKKVLDGDYKMWVGERVSDIKRMARRYQPELAA
jgi:hypothetical protein